MADYKNQHYVPRCVLRPFSLGGDSIAINVFNLSREKPIKSAPLKSQCARDYFYGRDLDIEKSLGKIEGRYSEIIKLIETRNQLNMEDLEFLRFCIYLQRLRTEMALTQAKQLEVGLLNAAFSSDSSRRPTVRSDTEIVLYSLRACIESSHYLEGIKIRLLENRTGVDFITSDDPAVITNKFHSQRGLAGGFGITNSGFVMFMPLTPRWVAFGYDLGVYTVSQNCLIDVRDVRSINELIYINALHNVYFRNWDDAGSVSTYYQEAKGRRVQSRFEISKLVSFKDEEGCEVFRAAESEDEWIDAGSGMIAASANYPQPTEWPRFLRYRHKIKTYSNGTAVGHVRRPEWLRGRM